MDVNAGHAERQDMHSGVITISRDAMDKAVARKKAGDFSDKLPGIIRELEIASAAIAKQVEEAEHKAEIQRKQYEQQCEIERQRREEERRRQALEEAERRRVKAIKDSHDELSDIIKAWAKAKRFEEFFADVERRTVDLEDEDKAAVLERLTLARKMVDNTDALKWLTSWKTPEERNT
jgi:GTP1/Obg family GTP-binding protein